jgi:hypothetical protein
MDFSITVKNRLNRVKERILWLKAHPPSPRLWRDKRHKAQGKMINSENLTGEK